MTSKPLILAPSILSADFAALGRELARIRAAGARYVHIDVMDGHFVPNITMGVPVVRSLRRVSDLVFDVHLMISEPERYAAAFARAGADIVCFHIEAAADPAGLVRRLRELNIRPAVAIKPDTPAESVFGILADVDMVLVMSVEPGFGGQELIPHTLLKARLIRERITDMALSCDVEMDGGLTLENARLAIEAGVNVVVVGSEIFESGDAEGRAREYVEMFGRIGNGSCKDRS